MNSFDNLLFILLNKQQGNMEYIFCFVMTWNPSGMLVQCWACHSTHTSFAWAHTYNIEIMMIESELENERAKGGEHSHFATISILWFVMGKIIVHEHRINAYFHWIIAIRFECFLYGTLHHPSISSSRMRANSLKHSDCKCKICSKRAYKMRVARTTWCTDIFFIFSTKNLQHFFALNYCTHKLH